MSYILMCFYHWCHIYWTFINITLLLIKITLAIFASQFTAETDAKLSHFITSSSKSIRVPSAVNWLPEEGWQWWHFRGTLSRGDTGKDTQRHGHLVLLLANHISKIWPKSNSWSTSSGTYYSRNCQSRLVLTLKGRSENLWYNWK